MIQFNKGAVLVAFQISKLRGLKNLRPWKLMENFLILVTLFFVYISNTFQFVKYERVLQPMFSSFFFFSLLLPVNSLLFVAVK